MQSAATDTAGRCNLVDGPAAGRIGFEQIERPFERAGYELRNHAGPLQPQEQQRQGELYLIWRTVDRRVAKWIDEPEERVGISLMKPLLERQQASE